MSKLLAQYHRFLNQEPLSVWLITLAITLNIAAWVIPRGSYQNPSHDPLKIGSLVSQVITDGQALYYFWHAVITLTIGIIAYGAFQVWTLGLTRIVNRIDL